MVERERALIFDVEGTLIDCVQQTLDCWEETLAQFHLRADRSALAHQSGADGRLMLQSLFPSLPDARADEILSAHAALYKKRYLYTCRAFPGVKGFFCDLQREGHVLAIATTCSAEELAAYDRQIDALRYCAVVESGSQVKRGKPYPDLFAAVLRKLDTRCGTPIVVGDTPYDAIGARHSGLPTIGVLTGGFTASELLGAGCSAVIATVVDLVNGLPAIPM